LTPAAFSFAAPGAPAWYACAGCRTAGVKLWRKPHIDVAAWCAACAERAGKMPEGAVGADGCVERSWGRDVQVAGLVPYVPDEEGLGAYGCANIPAAGAAWWRRLPTRPAADVSKGVG